jgi:serine/threonine protein kinase
MSGGAMLFTPPVIAARYRLARLLGTGDMGAVYLAHDELCTADVAVKMIGEHLAGDELAVRRFKREARLCARLRHPNVVAGLDAGYDPAAERHFIVRSWSTATTPTPS